MSIFIGIAIFTLGVLVGQALTKKGIVIVLDEKFVDYIREGEE